MKKKKLWSVPRITHPQHPGITVRVGEFEAGGVLQVFRQVNGRQTSRSLKVRRAELGRTSAQQVQEAKKLGADYIDELMVPKPAAEAASASGTTLTFGQLADKYELDGFAGRTPAYKRDALAAIRRIAAVLGSEMRVGDLKPSDVQHYVAHRLAENKKLHIAHRADLVALKIALNWAVGEELLEVNPFAKPGFKKVMPAKPPKEAIRRPVMTRERYEKMVAVASRFPPLFGVLLTLAWETGHRLSAILELRWKDVVFEKSDHAPHGSLSWYTDSPVTKKRHPHRVAMNARAAEALRRWQKEAPGVGDTPLFPSTAKEFAKRTWRKAERAAKVGHLAQGAWHSLRRGWRTARKHLPDVDVQAAGGWTDSVTMNLSYNQSDPETVLAVVNGG